MHARAYAAALLIAGCGGRTIVGGGAAHSYGSVSVPGNEQGIGVSLEVGHYRRVGSGSIGGVVAIDAAGYTGAGDGDGIFWSELQIRYRRDLRGHGKPGPFLAFGPAIGYGLGDSVDGEGIFGGIVELGYEFSLSETLALDVSVRERPALFVSDGRPRSEFNNTLVLGLDLVIGNRRN